MRESRSRPALAPEEETAESRLLPEEESRPAVKSKDLFKETGIKEAPKALDFLVSSSAVSSRSMEEMICLQTKKGVERSTVWAAALAITTSRIMLAILEIRQ